MTKAEAIAIAPGLYRVQWKHGGTSVAAVGKQADGTPWLAPTNWLQPAIGVWWRKVEALTRIEV